MSNYPSPRYLKLKRPKSIEDLMPLARQLVSLPFGTPISKVDKTAILATGEKYESQARGISYEIKSGDRVLLVMRSEDSVMVTEALCRAVREKEAHINVFIVDSSPVGLPEDVATYEATTFDQYEDQGDYNYFYTMGTDQIRTKTAKLLVEFEKYNLVISGRAGPRPPVSFPWEKLWYTQPEDFAGPVIDFPPDLERFINVKAWEQIKSCKTFKLTDPEGTHVEWTNYWDERLYLPGHLLARPLNIGYGFGGKDDCNGIVAGTLNHIGAFPNCKAYIKNGKVVKVEGGGSYGKVWQEKLDKYKDIKMPPLPVVLGKETMYEVPEPGLFWFMECAIGSSPKQFRLLNASQFQCFDNFAHERSRAGYIHCGFGPPMAYGKYELVKVGLPWSHVHIHLVFATLEGITADGKKITIIDKGHLAALDDPEVRSMAQKYGDQNELLSEAWIPAIPGINFPGDYMKDYGENPVAWIKREGLENPIWID